MARVILIDTREKNPLEFSGVLTAPATMDAGDYSIKGLSHLVRVERKAFGEFCKCVGSDRERFNKQIKKLRAYPYRIVVIEGWPEKLDEVSIAKATGGKSRVTHEMVNKMIEDCAADCVCLYKCRNRKEAADFILGYLTSVAERRRRELMACENITGGAGFVG
jgi:ERCC4-type nuclease